MRQAHSSQGSTHTHTHAHTHTRTHTHTHAYCYQAHCAVESRLCTRACMQETICETRLGGKSNLHTATRKQTCRYPGLFPLLSRTGKRRYSVSHMTFRKYGTCQYGTEQDGGGAEE